MVISSLLITWDEDLSCRALVGKVCSIVARLGTFYLSEARCPVIEKKN